jgi:CspA family cold shock protein
LIIDFAREICPPAWFNSIAQFARERFRAGVVKWFNPEKGFGFITPECGGKDVFVHITALEKEDIASIEAGDRVLFQILTNRGKEAARIILKEPPPHNSPANNYMPL